MAEDTSRSNRARPDDTTLSAATGSTVDAGPVSLADDTPRYQAVELLDEGGMGTVHIAREPKLRRRVAYKQIIDRAPDPTLVRRFLTEAQITAQLDHPNIVPVYGLEVDAHGRAGYAMKLVAGQSLRQIIDDQRRKPDTREALAGRLEVFLKVCDAMAFAHNLGVIHRDLKPANIMVGPFHEVYVMDWGIARILDAPDTLATGGSDDEDSEQTSTDIDRTRNGTILGTPAYMSPEQAAGDLDRMGRRSDVMALGLILYEIAHLARAYQAPTVMEVLFKVMNAEKEPPPAGSIASAGLRAIIDRATRADPADRYASVTALGEDVRRWLRDEETEALPDNSLRRLRRWMVHHQRTTLTIVLCGLLISAGLVAWSHYRERAEIAEERLHGIEQRRRVGAVVEHVGQRAQRIANHFVWHEGLVEGLAGTASMALTTTVPWEGPIYRDFAYISDPEKLPTGTVHSEHYQRSINPDVPHYNFVGESLTESLEADVRRLYNLTPQLKSMFLTGPGGLSLPETEDRRRQRILAHEVAIEWVYVGLESGVMINFPASASELSQGYDARLRPWYRAAKKAWSGQDARRRHWTPPYQDIFGRGLVITCTQAVTSGDGKLLGVAALDLSFEYIVDAHMRMSGLTGFKASYLLDREGRVMLRTDATQGAGPAAAARRADEDSVDFGRFADDAVVAEVRAGRSGQRVRRGDHGGRELVVWSRMQHLAWTFVVVIDEAVLATAALPGEWPR